MRDDLGGADMERKEVVSIRWNPDILFNSLFVAT